MQTKRANPVIQGMQKGFLAVMQSLIRVTIRPIELVNPSMPFFQITASEKFRHPSYFYSRMTSISKVLHQQYLIESLHTVRGWRRAPPCSPTLSLIQSKSQLLPAYWVLPGWHSSSQMARLCLSILLWSRLWLIGGRDGCSNDETMLINSYFLGPMC